MAPDSRRIHPGNTVRSNMSIRQLLSRSTDANPRSSGGNGRHGIFFLLQSVERELWFLAVAVMLMDVTLTVHGLALGLEERNVVARWVLNTAGAPGLYGLKTAALLYGFCCRPLLPDHTTPFVPLVLAVPSAIAVGVNTVLILNVLS